MGQGLNRLTMVYQAQREREAQIVQQSPQYRQGGQSSFNFPPQDAIGNSANHEITGIQDWSDLDDFDCALMYKNDFEVDAGF